MASSSSPATTNRLTRPVRPSVSRTTVPGSIALPCGPPVEPYSASSRTYRGSRSTSAHASAAVASDGRGLRTVGVPRVNDAGTPMASTGSGSPVRPSGSAPSAVAVISGVTSVMAPPDARRRSTAGSASGAFRLKSTRSVDVPAAFRTASATPASTIAEIWMSSTITSVTIAYIPSVAPVRNLRAVG